MKMTNILRDEGQIDAAVPEWLLILKDMLVKGMCSEKAKTWPMVFLEAIQARASKEDLIYKVKYPFLEFVLKTSLQTFDPVRFPKGKKAVDDVLLLLEEKTPSSDIWLSSSIACVAAYVPTGSRTFYCSGSDASAYAAAFAAAAAARAVGDEDTFVQGVTTAAKNAATAAKAAKYAAYVACTDTHCTADAVSAGHNAVKETYTQCADKLIELLEGMKNGKNS